MEQNTIRNITVHGAIAKKQGLSILERLCLVWLERSLTAPICNRDHTSRYVACCFLIQKKRFIGNAYRVPSEVRLIVVCRHGRLQMRYDGWQ